MSYQQQHETELAKIELLPFVTNRKWTKEFGAGQTLRASIDAFLTCHGRWIFGVSSSCDPRHGVAMDDVDFKPQIAQMAQIAQSVTSGQVVLAVSVSPFSGWRRVIETSNFLGIIL